MAENGEEKNSKSPSMAENGEEKLIAVARHIAKTLGHTDSMTDDILNIFSNFDGRLREKLSDDGAQQTLKSLNRRLSPYISSDVSIWSSAGNPSSFLDLIDQLIAAIGDWTPLADDSSISSCLDRAEDLLQQCMFRLEDEFRSILERAASCGGESTRHPDYSDEDDDVSDEDEEEINVIAVADPVTDYDFLIDALPAGTIGDLHEIARRMVAAGYTKECAHVYSCCRREFLEQSFNRLGFQKLGIDEIQKMQWTELEDEIEKWINAMNVALRFLFPSERRLCDRVFSGLSSASEISFMEVCRGPTLHLLDFADAVAISSREPERLFKVLDVYETVRDLLPEFELIFCDDYCLCLKDECISVWNRLGEVIRCIFIELENLIRRDPAKSAVSGGGLHPITRYVMNYLRALCRSKQTLEEVFDDHTKTSSSSLSVQLSWTMELLESNLEAKSKNYRDTALSSVFMMNNWRYIVQKVKDNELGSLLGDDWIRKHMSKVRQHHVKYQRSCWSKVLEVLKIDHTSVSSNGAAKSLREKLKLFNVFFDEICKTQSTWVIFDDQLKEELKISISGTLLPAYRNFMGRVEGVADIRKHIRYSVEDIDRRISGLFQGNANGRR